MTDSITSCIVYKRSNDEIHHYDITFAFEIPDSASQYSVIAITDSDLTNPTDLDEVKTLACSRAAVLKALYATSTAVQELIGPVEL